MKCNLAFICGSLVAAACSFGISWVNGSHIGRCLTFLIIGAGGGLVLAGIGVLVTLLAWLHRAEVAYAPAAGALAAFFFLPVVLVLGLAWLFSLGTTAS